MYSGATVTGSLKRRGPAQAGDDLRLADGAGQWKTLARFSSLRTCEKANPAEVFTNVRGSPDL